MGVEFLLTPVPVYVTTDINYQVATAALDVSAFDVLDIEAVVTVVGATSGLALQLISQMDVDTLDGAFYYSFSGSIFGSATVTLSLYGGFFRYLRWTTQGLGGASGVSFTISGIGRTFAELRGA